MLGYVMKCGHHWATAILLITVLSNAPELSAQKKGSASPASATSPSSAAGSAGSQGASASNAPVEVEMLSYGAMDQILARISDYACTQKINGDLFKKILVLDTPTLQSLQAYDSFYANAEALKTSFMAMYGQPGAGGGIDDFADITNAVATVATASTTESSFSFTIQDPTVAITLLHHLQSPKNSDGCKQAHYAGVYTVSEVTGAKIKAHEVRGKTIEEHPLNNVSEELSELAITRMLALQYSVGQYLPPPDPGTVPCLAMKTSATGITIGGVVTGGTSVSTTTGGTTSGGVTTGGTTTNGVTTGGTTTGGTTTGGTTTVKTTGGTANGGAPVLAVSSQDPCVGAFNNLDTTYNSFLAGLSTPNSTTGTPALASMLQGYPLRALFLKATETDPILAIYVNVAAAGGTEQDRKNLLLALFYGDWIRYSGGVSINVIVFQIAGDNSKILFSDLLRYRTPLKQISAPKGYNGAGTAGDNLDDLK